MKLCAGRGTLAAAAAFNLALMPVTRSRALPAASRTLRPGNGRPAVSDGAFAATDEPLGAFFIIEAADMDEAIEVAAKHPGAHLGACFGGGIEVRPIDTLDQPAG
jgi:hypothetical protein